MSLRPLMAFCLALALPVATAACSVDADAPASPATAAAAPPVAPPQPTVVAATSMATATVNDSAVPPDTPIRDTSRRQPATAVSTAAPTPQAAGWPRMIVHKSPSCGCCGAWVEHMRDAGFTVEVRNQENLEPVKSRLGVPFGKGSCHTAEVGGYFVEGHVPASDVKRLLAQKPDAKGLTVPGMPIGSPGMEMPDGSVQAYSVELVGRDGNTTTFTRHGE